MAYHELKWNKKENKKTTLCKITKTFIKKKKCVKTKLDITKKCLQPKDNKEIFNIDK